MSGIFAFAGNEPCRDILLDGISKLEGRGKEASGIALLSDGEISHIKIKGAPSLLFETARSIGGEAEIGLAQCADACRCKASGITAPPSVNSVYAVALDGYIENFDALKLWTNSPFPIATDEDLLLALISIIDSESRIQIIEKLKPSLGGNPSYAFIRANEEAVYTKAGEAPLLVGICEKGMCLSSELTAMLPYAKKYFVLENGECARLTKDRAFVFDSRMKRIKKQYLSVPEAPSGTMNYLPSGEIYYCPLTVKETVKAYTGDAQINFDSMKLGRRQLAKIDRIILTGLSSSYHTAVLSAYNIEMLTDIPCACFPSGELRYSGTLFDKGTLLIAISCRGESEDTIACVKRAKSFGAKTIAVTDNTLSALAREADLMLRPCAEPACKSGSLRAFIASSLAMSLFTLYLGNEGGVISELYLSVAFKLAETLPGKISASVKSTPLLEETAAKLLEAENIFVTGIGADNALALEAAEKLRSLLSLQAVPASCTELSNEPKELIASSLIIAFVTNKDLHQKLLRHLRRLRSLGAETVIYTTATIENEMRDFENVISVPDSLPLFDTLTAVSALYKTAVTAQEIIAKEEEMQAG